MPGEYSFFIKIEPSRFLVLFLIFVHATAMFSVWLVPYEVSHVLLAKFVLCMLLVASYFYYYKKILKVSAVIKKSNDKWDLLKFDGRYCIDAVLENKYISDWIVILEFSNENEHGGRISAYLTANSVHAAVLSELICSLNIDSFSLLKSDISDEKV